MGEGTEKGYRMPERTDSPEPRNVLTIVLALIYALLLVGIILFKFPFNYDLTQNGRELNLIPFAGSFSSHRFGVSEVVENVLIFLPLGLYLSMLLRWSFGRRVVVIATISVVFEALQYAFAIGRSDITDVLENTAGGILGIGIYVLASRLLAARTNRVLNVLALVVTVLAVALFTYLRAHSR
jgi:glycopeptide antibiotics resistance protein